MFEQAILAEQFAELLDSQNAAVEFYAELQSRITDESLRGQIAQLCLEKQRHIELTQRLLEIVQ